MSASARAGIRPSPSPRIKGYAVAKVLIDSKNVGAVKSYTFENVKKNHTIEVVFMKASGNPQTGVFVDVPEGSYYEEAVNWAVEKGITTGTDVTHFSPDGICTRAQAVTFLWRAAGSPAAKSAVMPFTDVKAGSYYYDAVLWAVENGITKGTSDTMFSPDATCSRAQIVTFLWRSQKSPAAGTANPFTDVKASAYYADAVLWAVKEDVTKGTTNTTFSPDANCTRAQIVTFIWRALAEARMTEKEWQQIKRLDVSFVVIGGVGSLLITALIVALSYLGWFDQFTDSGLLSSLDEWLVTVLIGGILLVPFLIVTVIGILLVRSDLRIERERRKKPPEPPDEFFSLYEWLNSKAAGKDP